MCKYLPIDCIGDKCGLETWGFIVGPTPSDVTSAEKFKSYGHASNN